MTKIKVELIIIIIILLAFLIYYALFPYYSPDWTGFRYYNNVNQLEVKKLWDWLDLLIVPVSLILLGWLYKTYEKTKEEIKEIENKQNEILDSYFRIISEFISNSNLLDTNKNKESRVIARTRTIVALENLEGERKGQVLQFLYESNLIDNEKINILGANFKCLQVSGIVLRKLTIKGVYFCNSNFENTFLDKSRFISCDFTNTNFNKSSMEDTSFEYSNLSKCKLSNIDLTKVNFEGSNLNDADLSNSIINRSQLDKIFKKKNLKLNNTEIL